MTIKHDLQTIYDFMILGLSSAENVKQAWHDDKIRLKTNFTAFIDDLQKSGYIGVKTAQNVYLYENKKHQIILTCLSYNKKLA